MTLTYEKSSYSQSRSRRRLFSGSGKFVGLQNLPHAFQAFSSAIKRKLLNAYPDAPFIPYSAAAALAPELSQDKTVVEIGSGMSTPWLASRAHWVVSYEWDRDWYSRIQHELRRRGLGNVDLRFCVGHEQIGFEDIDDSSIDLGFIDGGPRSLCLFNLWSKLKIGGLVYLDNWDSDLFWLEGGNDAREFLRERQEEIAWRKLFVDFVPAYVNVSEGLLVKKRCKSLPP